MMLSLNGKSSPNVLCSTKINGKYMVYRICESLD